MILAITIAVMACIISTRHAYTLHKHPKPTMTIDLFKVFSASISVLLIAGIIMFGGIVVLDYTGAFRGGDGMGGMALGIISAFILGIAAIICIIFSVIYVLTRHVIRKKSSKEN